MSPLSRGGIPVPRDDQRAAHGGATIAARGREAGGAGGAGGRGMGEGRNTTRNERGTNVHGNNSGNRARAAAVGTANNHARRPSTRDAGQAPWRSSLDLVWSYSRSQAFYGENIATSPSFADRHWAGPSYGVEETSEEEEEEDEEEEEEDEEDDEEYDDEDDLASQSPAGAMEWGATEQLPPNAVPRQQTSKNNVLGRRVMRNAGERSPGRRGDPHRVMNRNISRITSDSNEEERSRSRSRSPKRVNLSRPTSSSLRTPMTSDRVVRSLRSTLTSADAAAAKRDGEERGRTLRSDNIPASEQTPLLRDSSSNTSLASSHVEAQQAPLQHRRKQRPTLRTPSWFRNSNVSASSQKYHMQGYGTSTFWQSWFNTVNALVGVGILALPLAISYAGLIPGMIMFILCGLVTNYTGKVLAHIMSAEPSMRTYADIGSLAFGPRARFAVAILFCLELWAVSTALVILFGDSLRSFFIAVSRDVSSSSHFVQWLAHLSPAAFKAFGVALVLPTMFLSLRLLSPISVVGIVSVITLFVVVLCDGLIKQHAPGSLRDPFTPSLAPQWSKLPLSFGLIMSGFSSHPIIPSLFKDMRNPKQFCRMLDWAYVAATVIYLAMGLVGYLMFGRGVSDEITRDISQTPGYPRALNMVALWLIIINPLSKFALAARPIITTIEILLGVEHSQVNLSPSAPQRKSYAAVNDNGGNGLVNGRANQNGSTQASSSAHDDDQANGSFDQGEDDYHHADLSAHPGSPGESPLAHSAISLRAAERTRTWSANSKGAIRMTVLTLTTLCIGLTAILLPGFERVMAFLGAFLASATCVFAPLLAKIVLLRHEATRTRIVLDTMILFTFFIVAALGTAWSFIPSR